MIQTHRFKQVDVFTQQPFRGNPVAVVLDAEGLSSETMQQIAAWTNLSETTFVLPPTVDQADYRLRIFTPKRELPFAGHPTIGSAHAVLESGFAVAQNGKLRQECLAGVLELSIQAGETGQQILAQAPPAQVSSLSSEAISLLTQALGLPMDSTHPPLRVDVGPVWLIADLGDADTVAALQPDLALLTRLSQLTQSTGVTVLGRSKDGMTKLHVRSFAPADGIPEDPVCGSGNISVAEFLMHSGLIEPTKTQYIARQGMQLGRDGRIYIQITNKKIEFGGYAITSVDGTLRSA